MSGPRALTIVNKLGLHARASRKFVETAGRFDAVVTVAKDGSKVNADSLMELLMLVATIGTVIEVEAHGPDAEAALDALEALVADKFGEEREDEDGAEAAQGAGGLDET